MQKYKVSVIIPTYNRADLVSLAISSVLNQSYEHLELIVVDDGSKDHTKSVIETFLADSRLKYVLLENNRGRSTARNVGLEHVSGDFVMFLDSDDYLEPDAIERLIGLRNKYPQVKVFAGGYRLFENKSDKECTIYKIGKDLFIEDMFLEEIKEMVLNVGNNMLHIDLVKKKGVWFNENLNFAEDWEFMLNAVRDEQAVLVENTVLNVFRHEDNSCFYDIQKSILNVAERHISFLTSDKPGENKIYIDNFKLRLLMAYNRNGNKLSAFKYLRNLRKSQSINKKSWLRELLFLPIPSPLLIFFRSLQLRLKTYLNLICSK